MTQLQNNNNIAMNTTYDLPTLPSIPHLTGQNTSTHSTLQKVKQPKTVPPMSSPVPQIQTLSEQPGHDTERHHTRTRTQGKEMSTGTYNYCKRSWEAGSYAPWLSPHTAEHQKRTWYHESLGMGTTKVVDQWGFSSANVSRSHSPVGDMRTINEGVTSGQK